MDINFSWMPTLAISNNAWFYASLFLKESIIIQEREKPNAEKDQLNIQLLSFAPIDREKIYPKMCMNRIMLIIEYMNEMYALKKLDNHFYHATSSFCIRILSRDICILFDIRRLVPWSDHSGVLQCTLVHCTKVLLCRRGFRIIC